MAPDARQQHRTTESERSTLTSRQPTLGLSAEPPTSGATTDHDAHEFSTLLTLFVTESLNGIELGGGCCRVEAEDYTHRARDAKGQEHRPNRHDGFHIREV